MTDQELFDISDIEFDFIPRKGKYEVLLLMKAERQITLFRFYLALKAYVQNIENEIGVMGEQEAEH